MRQRLGIASALMGDPDVLILDEPANGLDPAGIRWMRGLLRDFADRGGTVLLSSHLLHEIEVVADDLVVIGNGRIVAHGAKDDLLRSCRVVGPGSAHLEVVARALQAAGIETSRTGADVLHAQAESERVGQVAFAARRTRSSSCALPRAPVWRRCSCKPPPTPNEKDESHEYVRRSPLPVRTARERPGGRRSHPLSLTSDDASPCGRLVAGRAWQVVRHHVGGSGSWRASRVYSHPDQRGRHRRSRRPRS